jgi:hypothetical protein
MHALPLRQAKAQAQAANQVRRVLGPQVARLGAVLELVVEVQQEADLVLALLVAT